MTFIKLSLQCTCFWRFSKDSISFLSSRCSAQTAFVGTLGFKLTCNHSTKKLKLTLKLLSGSAGISSSKKGSAGILLGWFRGVASHIGEVALATPKNKLFLNWLVCIYIRLPQVIKIELPQSSSVVKNQHISKKRYYMIDRFICIGLILPDNYRENYFNNKNYQDNCHKFLANNMVYWNAFCPTFLNSDFCVEFLRFV